MPYPSRRYGVYVPALTKRPQSMKINKPYPEKLNTPYSRYGINIIFWKISNVVPTLRNPQYVDDPNMTMEEYIKFVEEKACMHGRVFNWQTTTYGKVRVDEDLYDLRSVGAEFPAIVIDDTVTPHDALPCKYQVSTPVNDEIDFRISFDESDDEDYIIICDINSFSYKMIFVNDLKMYSENDNDKVNMPVLPSPEPTVSYFDDLDYFKDFEKEFSAIVYNDAQTSKLDFLTEPTVSPHHIDEFYLKSETSLSECDEEEQNVLYFNDLFPFNVVYPNNLKSDKDNDDDKVDIEHSSGNFSVKPLCNVINTNDGAYAHRLKWTTPKLRWRSNQLEEEKSLHSVVKVFNSENLLLVLMSANPSALYTSGCYTGRESDGWSSLCALMDKVNMHFLPSPEPMASYFNDLDYFKDFEKEFPAIVYNDAQTSKSDLLTEPILHEFNLKDETALSEYDEEEQNVICFNDLFLFNVIYPNELKTDTDNDNDKVDIEHSSKDLYVEPLPDVINTDVGAYAQWSNKLLETSINTAYPREWIWRIDFLYSFRKFDDIGGEYSNMEDLEVLES
ncbi:hypothetical protein Tco_1378676 [Tanacetum coccineum]